MNISEVKVEEQVVVNGIDNPNVMSVDSTEPIPTKVDVVVSEEDVSNGTGKPEDKKVEEKVEDKVIEKDEKSSTDESKKPEDDDGENTKDKVQKRINDLTKLRRTAERERDWERAKRAELEEELGKLKSKVPPADKPDRSNYEDDTDYLEALTDWKVSEKLKENGTKSSKETEELNEKNEMHEAFEEIDSVIVKGKEKFADFEEVALNSDLKISLDMTEAILSSSIPEKILYHLGKNPDLSAEIAEMKSVQVIKEILKIENELSVVPKTEKKKEEIKINITKAPEPITPVKTDGITEKDPSDLSPKEYRAWRERSKG